MKLIYHTIVILILLAGCGREDPVYTPYVENYSGTYMWRNPQIVIDAAQIDSVSFTITDGAYYAFRFYKLHATDQVDFCDCDGRLTRNTSSVITFEPTVVIYMGCDSLRVPRGDFVPDYITHQPDTVYFEKSFDTSLYQLVVIRK